MADDTYPVVDEAAAAEAEAAAADRRQRNLDTLKQARAISAAKRTLARQKKKELAAEIVAEPAPGSLFDLDPDIADILTPKELADLYAEAKLQVAAEVKGAKKKEIRDRLLVRARREAGLLPTPNEEKKAWNEWLAEPCSILINIAEYADRITINGFPYHHGRTYPVTRAVYETLNDQMAMTWRHQAEIDGKRKNYYNQQHGWLQHNGAQPSSTVNRRI